MIHVCFSLSPFPVPLRRVVHALQHQKIAPFMYGIRLDDYQEINGVSLLGRRVLMMLPSVTYCTSQLTSQRACKYCCVVVYTDTQKKVRFISFLPSDMMHVHFASRKVAKKQGPKCQFQKDVKSRCII